MKFQQKTQKFDKNLWSLKQKRTLNAHNDTKSNEMGDYILKTQFLLKRTQHFGTYFTLRNPPRSTADPTQITTRKG